MIILLSNIKKIFPKIICGISEVGKYIAIDLSGKNLRIMLLTLKGSNKEPEQINHNYVFPASVMKGTGDQVRFCFYDFVFFYAYKLLNPQTWILYHFCY